MKPAAGSLFSGIGGLDLAFSLANFDILFQVEIDAFCRKVLAKHASKYWCNATQFTDVRTVGRRNLPEVEVLFGGFPCQSISIAGPQQGIREGTASGLWFEFRRIIGELRPRIVFLENVPNITHRDGTVVIADLTALGYDCRWGIISAADAGAPHKRERWFCVAVSTTPYARGNRGQWVKTADASGSMARLGCKRGISNGGVVAYTDKYGAHYFRAGQAASHPHRKRKTAQCQWHNQQHRVIQYGQPVVNTDYPRRKKQRRTLSIQAPQSGFTRPGGQSQNAKTQSGVGWTKSHGLPAWLVRPQWAARPGEPQYDYEPPRTLPGFADRKAQIKAYGNAVLPAVAFPIAMGIRHLLECVSYRPE